MNGETGAIVRRQSSGGWLPLGLNEPSHTHHSNGGLMHRITWRQLCHDLAIAMHLGAARLAMAGLMIALMVVLMIVGGLAL